MAISAPLPRRLGIAFGAVLMALALMLAVPAIASAHGCGTTDHWYGFGPHYYEGKVTIGNSRYTRWLEVGLGSAVHTSTWCGCVIQSQPCIR
jgi:hypothetical protein